MYLVFSYKMKNISSPIFSVFKSVVRSLGGSFFFFFFFFKSFSSLVFFHFLVSRKGRKKMEDLLNQWFPGEKPDPLGDAFGKEKYQPNVLTHNMPLMDVRHAVVISIAYIVVVFVLVQVMKMKERPFELFYFRVIHNAFLVLVSGYLTVGIGMEAWKNNYSLFCNDGISPDADRPMAFLIWVFYVSKIYEFLDTVIMAFEEEE